MPHETDECRQVFAMLSEYLDLQLPPEACRDMEAHLAGCPPCIEFVQSLRKTVAMCRAYQPSELPEPISQEARARLQEAWERAIAGRESDSGQTGR